MSDYAKEIFMRLVVAAGFEMSNSELDEVIAYALRIERAVAREWERHVTSTSTTPRPL